MAKIDKKLSDKIFELNPTTGNFDGTKYLLTCNRHLIPFLAVQNLMEFLNVESYVYTLEVSIQFYVLCIKLKS